tara:strand:+ start:19366 stop:20160 length:795 start_codon:yes stop_codon:yes gene_type:complete
MNKILILGYNSMIGSEFIKQYKRNYILHAYNRGTKRNIKVDREINGNINELNKNPEIDKDYDYIINLIFLENKSVNDNLAYIEQVINIISIQTNLKKLIHISSTMVHGYGNKSVSISSPPNAEKNLFGYSLIKSETESLLHKKINNLNIIRFGFVTEDYDFTIKKFFKIFALFKGTFNRVIPVTKKSTALNSIQNCITKEVNEKVIISIDEECSYSSLTDNVHGLFFYIPKTAYLLILFFSKIFHVKKLEARIRILNTRVTYGE